MWHSEDFMIADEVVADNAQCHGRVSFPHQTTFEDSSKQCDYSSKLNSDSGFLSGVNVNEDSAVITSSSIYLSEEEGNMKLKSAAKFSVSERNLDYNYEKKNNLNGQGPVKPQKELPRRITLRDLLRQDDDGDT